MCNFFGGPSQQEENVADQTQTFGNTLQADLSQQFQGQENAINTLQTLQQRIATGDTGAGFSPQENAAMVSQIQNQGAAQARNVTQAANATGGGEFSETGLQRATQQQLKEQAQSNASAQTSNALEQETQQNYAVGRQNASTAANVEANIVKSYNPEAFAQLAGSNLSTQFGQAQTINAQNIAKAQAIGNLALSGITSAATFGVGGLTSLGSGEGVGEGLSDFFGGGMNALSGQNMFSVNPGGGGTSSGTLSS